MVAGLHDLATAVKADWVRGRGLAVLAKALGVDPSDAATRNRFAALLSRISSDSSEVGPFFPLHLCISGTLSSSDNDISNWQLKQK
jgi:hypothetical protein